MTIKDLALLTTFKETKKAIKFYYPKDRNDYEPVWDFIIESKFQEPKIASEHIVVMLIPISEWDDESYYAIRTNKYSMSFRDWTELCSIPVSKDTLNHYRYPEILAHFIWEITYYGTEEEMRETGKELFESAAKSYESIKQKTNG